MKNKKRVFKRWSLYDPKGQPWGWICDTRSAAVAQKGWEEPFAPETITWEDARRHGWSVRKILIMEETNEQDK